jgi:hypothetical protein
VHGQDADALRKALEKAALLSRFNAKEPVTASEVAADAHAVQYNEALTLLRDRSPPCSLLHDRSYLLSPSDSGLLTGSTYWEISNYLGEHFIM